MNTEISTLRQAVFRCDGGTGIGFGHVTRCLALAEGLAELDWSCRFCVSRETADLDVLKHTTFDIFVLEEPFSANSLVNASDTAPDLLVIDHYGLDSAYESACRPWAERILVFDDAPGRPHDADFLLDSACGRQASDYAAFVPGQCHLLLGSEYMMLRSEFSSCREQSLRHQAASEQVEIIFLSFGGADSHGLANHALTALERVDRPLRADIAIGSNAGHLAAMEKQAVASGHRVTIHRDCARIGELLATADIAIGAGGINAWERCALGVPSIMVCAADNQRGTYEALTKAGAALGAGIPDDDISSAIGNALEKLLKDRKARQRMSRSAVAMCKGRGAHHASVAMDRFIRSGKIAVSDCLGGGHTGIAGQ